MASRYQSFSKELAKSLFSGGGAYQLAFSFAYGMNIWRTFIGGIIQFKSLPRQQFGQLQARQFPVYFGISTSISSGLLAHWILHHPEVAYNVTSIGNVDVLQAWTLALVGAMQAFNYFYIGPKTSKLMFKRHKLERSGKKSYNEPGVSVEMKQVTKAFSAMHGLGSLTNLLAVFGLTFHGLWIAKFGTQGY